MRKIKKSFTLVELIIVIAIIAILAVSAFLVLTKWIGKSRDSRRLSDLGSLETAFTTYMSDYSLNPSGTLTVSQLNNTIQTGSNSLIKQGRITDDFLNSLSNFDVMPAAPKDPSWKADAEKFYVIAIDTQTRKYFSIGSTAEYQDTDIAGNKALIRGNYIAGNLLTDSSSNTVTGGASLLMPAVSSGASGQDYVVGGDNASIYQILSGTSVLIADGSGATFTPGATNATYTRALDSTLTIGQFTGAFISDGDTVRLPYLQIEE